MLLIKIKKIVPLHNPYYTVIPYRKRQWAYRYTSEQFYEHDFSSIWITVQFSNKKYNLLWIQWSCMMLSESSGEPLQTSSKSGERARESRGRSERQTQTTMKIGTEQEPACSASSFPIHSAKTNTLVASFITVTEWQRVQWRCFITAFLSVKTHTPVEPGLDCCWFIWVSFKKALLHLWDCPPVIHITVWQ